jgi:hypothetical protein
MFDLPHAGGVRGERDVQGLPGEERMSFKPQYAHLAHAVLVWAVCGKCKRGSYWSKLPAACSKPGCGGTVLFSGLKK